MDDVKTTKDLVNPMNIQTLKSYDVQISTDNKNWENSILFIKPFELSISIKDQKNSHLWKTISRFDYNKRTIYISFDEYNYTIQSSDISNLVSDLCEIIQRVLLPSELTNIDFRSLSIPLVGPGTESADSRFMMQRSLHTATPKKEIKSLIKYNTPFFGISAAKEAGLLLPIYLDVLPFIKTLKIIEFPIIGVDCMKSISNFPLELRYTRKIEITGSVKPILFTFLERVKQNQSKSKLNSLSFSIANFDRNDLSTISSSITKGPINSIEFHRSFHPSSVEYFYTTFLSHQINGMLWILNLDKTSGLDLRKLFPKLRNVPFVSLAFCDLDIIEVLTVASESKMSKLSILNLTGNNALPSSIEKVENIQTIFPLKKLILDKIKWPKNFLVQFLTVLFDRFNEYLSLSLSEAQASKDEWNEVFNFFKTTDYDKLIGISWNNNPIHKDLFHFLSRNDQLRCIEFDNCFDESSPEFIKKFSSIVKSASELRAISVSGSKEKHVGNQISSVIEACSGHEYLRRVNFSHSYGGDDVIPLFVKLIESTPSIKAVNFEGLGLSNQSSFVDSMLQLSKSREDLKVGFPLEDYNQFKEIISKEDKLELKNAFCCSYNDSYEQSEIEMDSINPASEPLLNKKRVYYIYREKEPFPQYITEKTIERLNDELVDIPNQIIDKQSLSSSFTKTDSYVTKAPAGEIKLYKKFSSSQKYVSSKNKTDEYEDNDQSYSENYSQTESEHPFPTVSNDISYSESIDKIITKKTQETKPKEKEISKLKEKEIKKPKEKTISKPIRNDDDDDDYESLTLSNPVNFLKSRKSSDMPKNLALSDYGSDEIYEQSTIRSPEISKVTISSDFDSLANSYSIDDVDFDVNPVFEKRRDYNFLSDVEVSRRSKTESSSFEFENAKSRKSIEKVIKKIEKKPIKVESEKQKQPEIFENIELLEEEQESSSPEQVKEKGVEDPSLLSEEYSSSLLNAGNKNKKVDDKFSFDIDEDQEIQGDENSNGNDQNQNKFDFDEGNESYHSYFDENRDQNEYSYGYSDGYYRYDKYSSYDNYYSDVNDYRNPNFSINNNNSSSLEIEIQNSNQRSIQVEINTKSNQNESQNQMPKEIRFPIKDDEQTKNKDKEKTKNKDKNKDKEINRDKNKNKDQNQETNQTKDRIKNKDNDQDIISNKNKNKDQKTDKIKDRNKDEDDDAIRKKNHVDDDDQNKEKDKRQRKRPSQIQIQKPKTSENPVKNREAEINNHPASSESGKEANFTPRTPNLSIFTKNIFDLYNDNNEDDDDINRIDEEESVHSSFDSKEKQKTDEINPVKSREVSKYVNKNDLELPPSGTERDWTFPIHFDMEPDMTQFKKIFKKYSPDVLYDQLQREKSFPSSPKARK